ncbi:hypothetical protein XM50_05450 [Sphingomonas sp. Ag1]|nr:hypothetical protein XM50_05450 [Sphingomonas sp. Ag1]
MQDRPLRVALQTACDASPSSSAASLRDAGMSSAGTAQTRRCTIAQVKRVTAAHQLGAATRDEAPDGRQAEP